MQSRTIRFALTAATTLLVAHPAVAKPATTTTTRHDTSRYQRMVSQYESLPPRERQAWLRWLLSTRLEPACRITMNDQRFRRAVARQRSILEVAAAGRELSRDGLLKLLVQVDQQEQAAIQRLVDQYGYVTQQAVGTNVWEYQRRMQTWEAIERLCDVSPYPFENQPRLIGWLEAALLEQRLSGRPPLPPAPNFDAVALRPWLSDRDGAEETKTSLEPPARPLDAAALAPRIAHYNASMGALKQRLYEQRVLDVDELNSVVDRIARLGLARIALSADALALDPRDRRSAGSIETLDDAISLARVKVSASRRQVLRGARGDVTSPEWRQLEGLNRVATRLDMLATGPDG